MNVALHHVTQREGNHSVGPGRPDAEAAFRTVLQWIGEDIDRDGLRETPARLVRAFEEYFSGYAQDPSQILQTTFEEIDGYDEMVVLRNVPFESHCEHHLAPIIGRAWVAYVPDRRLVGISKLARVVDAFARRLQIQERLTSQIAVPTDQVVPTTLIVEAGSDRAERTIPVSRAGAGDAITRLPDGWRVDWVLPGGGQQTTLVY